MESKRVTMSEIAERAGVSRTTVSYVLNDVPGVNIGDQTRERVLQVARDLNYQPHRAAQSLASGQVGAVALVLTQSPHLISDAFLSQVVSGVAGAVKPNGCHVLIEPLSAGNPEVTYGNVVRSRRADGIILVGPRPNDEELQRIIDEGIPLVAIGKLRSPDIPFVDVDNFGGAYRATEYLHSLGHRRIACITNAPLSHPASEDRLAGYREALRVAGVTYDEALVRYGNFTDESGYQAMAQILKECDPSPTAVFVASDVVALGAMRAVAAAGLQVPVDVAVVGFDDIPMAQYVTPALSSIRLPAYELGFEAGQMMNHLLQQPQDAFEHQIFLDTKLVVRQSCGGSR